MHTRVSAVVSAHLLRRHIDTLNTARKVCGGKQDIHGTADVAPTFFWAVIAWWSACVVALKQPPKHRGASRVRVHKLDQLHYEPERERKEHGRDEATSRRLHVDVETE